MVLRIGNGSVVFSISHIYHWTTIHQRYKKICQSNHGQRIKYNTYIGFYTFLFIYISNMPTKDFYQNDALIIQSLVFSCAQLVFLSVFLWKFGWLRKIKRGKLLKTIESQYVDVQKGSKQFYELMIGSWALGAAAFFNLAAFAFYFAGMFVNFNDYGQDGFQCGLLDNNPNRQWYYVVALILVAINFLFLWWFETKARYRLRVMAGLESTISEFVVGDVLEPIAEQMYKATKQGVNGAVRSARAAVGR